MSVQQNTMRRPLLDNLNLELEPKMRSQTQGPTLLKKLLPVLCFVLVVIIFGLSVYCLELLQLIDKQKHVRNYIYITLC